MACEQRITTSEYSQGRYSNAPLQPITRAVEDGMVKSCWNDSECFGSFTRCAKDRPEDIGICTRECDAHAQCTTVAAWSCEVGVWSTTPVVTKKMCMLRCTVDYACPRGTSCNDGYCGTPCVGPNCDCGEVTRACNDDGDVVLSDSCGTRAAETCAKGCAAGFCR